MRLLGVEHHARTSGAFTNIDRDRAAIERDIAIAADEQAQNLPAVQPELRIDHIRDSTAIDFCDDRTRCASDKRGDRASLPRQAYRTVDGACAAYAGRE